MKNNFRDFYRTIVLLIGISSFTMLQDGCSTVSIIAKQASKADDTFNKTEVALWWGLSDPVENVDCKGNGLQVVNVSTNWIYSLCSVVTLGAVVPVDVEYRCTTGSLQGGDTIGMKEK
jgi:hypothetical protein